MFLKSTKKKEKIIKADKRNFFSINQYFEYDYRKIFNEKLS